MTQARKNIYDIPDGQPFLKVLAQRLLEDASLSGDLTSGSSPASGTVGSSPASGTVGSSPASGKVGLGETTVFLPTRRSVRTLTEHLIAHAKTTSLLLPTMYTYSALHEEEDLLAEILLPSLFDAKPSHEAKGSLATTVSRDGYAAIPPAISDTQRLFTLASLIKAWAKKTPGVSYGPSQIMDLAVQLASLLDELYQKKIPFSALEGLVAERFSQNWRDVLDFLKIIGLHWPDIVKEKGGIDFVEHHQRVVESLMAHWKQSPPGGFIWVAGITATTPTSLQLLDTVAGLSNGAVIFHGIDQTLDDESFQSITPDHPHHAIKTTLENLQVPRKQVRSLTPKIKVSPRQVLLSQMMRPSATTHHWHRQTTKTQLAQGIKNLSLLTLPGLREEAGAIALLMRQALEDPKKTCALVTPDRRLARYVRNALARWNIEIDDSAGQPLKTSPPMSFLFQVLDTTYHDYSPVPLLSLLKHPLMASGEGRGDFLSLVRRFENILLRGMRAPYGVPALRQRLADMALDPQDKSDFLELLAWLEKCFAPLTKALMGDGASQQNTSSVRSVAQGVMHTAELCIAGMKNDSKEPSGAAADRLWHGEAGKACALFMAELLDHGSMFSQPSSINWRHLLESLAQRHVIRRHHNITHPRLAIWGLVEARLQQVDLIILGGLNEGTWPHQGQNDAWLNRPMRHTLGLDTPEHHVGAMAQDFVHGASGAQVVMTRATKVDGTPTVAARWLLRLQALLEGHGLEDSLAREEKIMAWLEMLDTFGHEKSLRGKAPAPCPPLHARPKRFSATQLERLVQDPYTFYARDILKLAPLAELETDLTALERGITFHEVLETFTKKYKTTLPQDIKATLDAMAKEAFARLGQSQNLQAFWWPQWQSFSQWFSEFESTQRRNVVASLAEQKGKFVLSINGTPYTLTAKVDRVDMDRHGALAIYDYKTGKAPKSTAVKRDYFYPQLLIAGCIGEKGGFENIPKAASAHKLAYISSKDLKQAPCFEGEEVATLLAQCQKNITMLLTAYENPHQGYDARRRYFKSPHKSTAGPSTREYYDYLSRIAEWQFL